MRQTQTARLLQQTMTTSTCRTLPRVRLVAILLHHSKIPRKPSSSNQGQSGPARCARQSRRQLRQPKTSQISQQPCFLAGHPEPAQHARPSRRQLHQPEILRQPCRLVEHSEPAQHARPSRPSRRMRCLLFQLPHVHRHAAHRPPRPRECLTSHSASYERKKAAAAASSSFPGSQHPNHTAFPRPPTPSSPQHIHPVPLSSACHRSSSSRSPNTS
jgi:hypothetical protein